MGGPFGMGAVGWECGVGCGMRYAGWEYGMRLWYGGVCILHWSAGE